MIKQYLSNTNENATVPILQNFLQLNNIRSHFRCSAPSQVCWHARWRWCGGALGSAAWRQVSRRSYGHLTLSSHTERPSPWCCAAVRVRHDHRGLVYFTPKSKKFSKFSVTSNLAAHAWSINYKQKQKLITQFVCKSQDESFDPS